MNTAAPSLTARKGTTESRAATSTVKAEEGTKNPKWVVSTSWEHLKGQNSGFLPLVASWEHLIAILAVCHSVGTF